MFDNLIHVYSFIPLRESFLWPPYFAMNIRYSLHRDRPDFFILSILVLCATAAFQKLKNC